MNKPAFYIVRFEGYADLDNPDHEWFLAENEEEAEKIIREMYEDYDLGNLEFYKVSGEDWYHNGKKYVIEVIEDNSDYSISPHDTAVTDEEDE